ncbi:MAG TPA: TraR/DksA C4-type zinc finger protein [Chitinophagaceae bacterium]|jgi:RNA polymerase-binding transcription factor DksA|nr:TraR/DksA C4-type zinc finger protein [Chitinophagaceae bacterium]
MPTKKPARPKGGKPAPKKAIKPAKKASPKKAIAKKPAKPAPKKGALKKPAVKKSVAKKPVAKIVSKKSEPKVNKPVVKEQAPVKKHETPAKSLVSVKPTIKPILKKEPPKPMKVVIPKTTTRSVKKYEPEFTKSVLDTPMNENTGPTQRYSDADLEEFRELITKKLDAAKKELAYLQGLITRKDEAGDMEDARYMTMEDGSVSMEREQLSQMASRQIQFIDHLEKAMMRIENKTYGICRVTGKLIDKARLRAVPHATLSIEAKQMMNK